MKLREYAQKMGIHYKTAWRWWKAGKLPGFQQDTGTVIVYPDQPDLPRPDQVAIYARVSAAEDRPNLERQAERLVAYCAAKGYQIHQVIKEVGSGVNDRRPKFLKLLADATITVIVVEQKDRATRFGFPYLETLLAPQGRRIEIVNLAENGKEDLVGDLVAIVSSFSAQLYGPRRAKRTTALIKGVLASEDHDAVG